MKSSPRCDGADLGPRLDRAFYDRPASAVARDLVGCLLVRIRDGGAQVVRVVETEAYVGVHDLASHASRGRTRRNEVMFGPPGYAYVYLIYGMYHMLNVVTSPAGDPQAVLIRAAEPVCGVTAATRGPGRLTRALGIGLEHNGLDLCGTELFFVQGRPARRLVIAPRIGVEYAGPWAEVPLRFYDGESMYVSCR